VKSYRIDFAEPFTSGRMEGASLCLQACLAANTCAEHVIARKQ
jgi:hypothetical protein